MFSVSPLQVLQRLQQSGEVSSGIALLCLPKFVEMALLLSSLLFLALTFLFRSFLGEGAGWALPSSGWLCTEEVSRVSSV